MKIFLAMSFTVFLALLVGCGGGGGDSGANSGGGTPPPPVSGTALGTRSVPGYQFDISTDLPPAAGAPRLVTLRVTPDADAPVIEQISAAITDDTAGEPTLTPGTPVAGTPNSWTWPVTLPADLVGKRIIVRLQDLNGNVSVTGLSDFALAP
jgi:hypothetical protein